MKKIRELTERQQKFLDVLFEQANGDPCLLYTSDAADE